MTVPHVVTVNVGRPRIVDVAGREESTAIVKAPVMGRLRLADDHVAGDHQADRANHGGPWQAVYAYASEDTAWWAQQLGRDDLGPGAFGENLTLAGLDPNAAVVGTRWQVGGARLRVTGPRVPCHKLAWRMGDPRFGPRFAGAGRVGAYLAIDTPGLVGAGDAVEVVDVPDHGITVRDVSDVHHRIAPTDPEELRELLERIAAAPLMHPSAVAFATARLDRD